MYSKKILAMHDGRCWSGGGGTCEEEGARVRRRGGHVFVCSFVCLIFYVKTKQEKVLENNKYVLNSDQNY